MNRSLDSIVVVVLLGDYGLLLNFIAYNSEMVPPGPGITAGQ